MKLSGVEPQLAFGIIKGGELLYVYPSELRKRRLLTNFLNTVLILVENVVGASKRVIFRVGGKIYVVSKMDSGVLFLSGPPHMDDGYASRLLDSLGEFLFKNFPTISQESLSITLIDGFISSLIEKEYAVIKIRKVHPSKIFIPTKKGQRMLTSGEIKRLNLGKQCIEMLRSFSPIVFLGEILEKVRIPEEDVSKCLESLYRLDCIIEAPDPYVSIMAILKMLNIVAHKTMALIGKSLVKETILEILNSMPGNLRKNIIFNEKNIRIEWDIAYKASRDVQILQGIGDEVYTNNMLTLKRIVFELFQKFEEILGSELRQQLNRVIKRELESKLKMHIM